MAPSVDQALLNTAFSKNLDLVSDMGIYESIGKTMAARIDGLVFLYQILVLVLDICPWCEVNYGQWRDAVLYAIDEGKKKEPVRILNHSTFKDKIWAGQRAERWVTVLYHLRRLKRNEDLVQSSSKKCGKDLLTKLQAMFVN
jgi:hypothetical protein